MQSRGKGGEVSTRTNTNSPVAVAPGLAGCYAFRRCAVRSRSVPPSSLLGFTGAHMKLSFNYKHVESYKPVEVEGARHMGKLERLLQSYSQDMIHLQVVFSNRQRTNENSC